MPNRVAPVITDPGSADSGGSKVFTALIAATSARTTARPAARSRRNAASASTSGSSGTYVRSSAYAIAARGKLTPVVAWQR